MKIYNMLKKQAKLLTIILDNRLNRIIIDKVFWRNLWTEV